MADFLDELEAFWIPTEADPAEVHIAHNYEPVERYRVALGFRGVTNG
jgi:hypothetical protein